MKELKVEITMNISSMENISGVLRISMSLPEGFETKQFTIDFFQYFFLSTKMITDKQI